LIVVSFLREDPMDFFDCFAPYLTFLSLLSCAVDGAVFIGSSGLVPEAKRSFEEKSFGFLRDHDFPFF